MISPILGMTLVEMVEVWTMIAALAPAGVAGVIWWTQHRIHQTHLRQQEKQAKIDSARLILSLRDELRTEGMRKIALKVFKGTVDLTSWDDEVWLTRYLNHMSLICKFYMDGLITEQHMDDIHGIAGTLSQWDSIRKFIEGNKTSFPHLYQYMLSNQDIK